MAHTRNTALAAAIREAGWSQEQTAQRFARVARESGALELAGTTRSHIAQWVRGVQPSGNAPRILCETLSRGLGRVITPAEIGLTTDEAIPHTPWSADPLSALVDVGGKDLDMERRQILAGTAYSVAALALPDRAWWEKAPQQARERQPVSSRTADDADVDSVREMVTFFSRRDQRRGGADGRAALVAYLRNDIATYLSGRFATEQVRQQMFTAAGETAYLAGWTAFDASEHGLAQRYFSLALRLAAEADDAPLAGHILRAMAHQAVDLRHTSAAVDLADASLRQGRYTQASPREKALLGVVHARSLAAAGRKKNALDALLRAEDDLSNARPGDEEPGRVWFFAEASLAHETACTLRDLGDLPAAEREFRRSVRTRRQQTFARTHSVTLGYLGAVQARQGSLEAACATWHQALDAMGGIHSGRARETVVQMRRSLSPFRSRSGGDSTAAALDARARAVLSRVG
ncbi:MULTISPECIES: Tat pathway signal protein [Streptomyces]|uniref:Tat pathway signal protein n=1 Tax=Streptomyces TaxID=1883 RepID=UPI00163CCA7A|nr:MULTISPECIES: Tat pathway signal protein [Streptomyces]MBC2879306.1 Tat pathway signal protein [Streptomyces sp. TYQ1024]UBI40094.1 Tat pathway signal protein [Streptomyces mobaraensis]UKW32673.1 Tat pathway signal protein [Streptomyces sp. TYQ1024]